MKKKEKIIVCLFIMNSLRPDWIRKNKEDIDSSNGINYYLVKEVLEYLCFEFQEFILKLDTSKFSVSSRSS